MKSKADFFELMRNKTDFFFPATEDVVGWNEMSILDFR